MRHASSLWVVVVMLSVLMVPEMATAATGSHFVSTTLVTSQVS